MEQPSRTQKHDPRPAAPVPGVPRAGDQRVLRAMALMMLGGLVTYAAPYNQLAGVSIGLWMVPLFVAGVFGFFVGFLQLCELFVTRSLWRFGDVVPGIVLRRARCPYLAPTVLAAVMATGTIGFIAMIGGIVVGIVGGAGLLVAMGTSRMLNSAQVLIFVDDEARVVHLPMADQWRQFDAGDCLWVANLGERCAPLHIVAPPAIRDQRPDAATHEWAEAKRERFIEENNSG